MNDPTIFANFLENVLQVRPTKVRDEIITLVKSFEDLLSSWDDKIEAFVKEVHSGNSARASNVKHYRPPNVVLCLKSILFKLKDRKMCDALTNATVLRDLDSNQVSSIKKLRRRAMINQSLRKHKMPFDG